MKQNDWEDQQDQYNFDANLNEDDDQVLAEFQSNYDNE